MVKKRLANGEPCRKCVQAEELLRNRGYWERIDDVVIADENDAASPGMQLAKKHQVDLAPFFIVRAPDGSERVYTSAIKFMKDAFASSPTQELEIPRAEVQSGLTQAEASRLARELAGAKPSEILRFGLERFGAECAIAFSGAEDVVLIDMAVKLGLSFSVFSLDTGRLHSETYRFIDKVRSHYGIEIALLSPNAELLEPFVKKKGLFSFYEDGHHECCGIRKVEPLKRALGGYRAWVTGQRKDQSVTRVDLEVVALDQSHSGSAGPLLKLNPLANWSSAQVWEYIQEQQLPYNALHDRGFVSIGCEPCTRAVRPGEHERAGRWWWEEETHRECGLHMRAGRP